MVRLQPEGDHLTALRWGWLILLGPALASADDGPEDRALAYLAREVPRWSAEHRCFSCHNNGDAARALYAAIRLGRPVPAEATADTDRWLSRPEGWEKNGGDGPFSDKPLARIQFASALAAAIDAGRARDRSALRRAALDLAEDQAEDGSWPVEDGGRVGSPAAYGRPLAAAMAIASLRAADPDRHRARIERGERWLLGLTPRNIPDASARLMALAGRDLPGAAEARVHDLDLLRRGQAPDGGWGPFADAAPEPFDTAIALLALDRHRGEPGVPAMLGRGRAFLVAAQDEDGSWPETTRPAGGESYAQRLSTTGWAALALGRSRIGRDD
ncbi:hypothetical protein TA3x_004353 [Tundrisphaera sp. TA3]|uniref:hypothetical protein n=1 Tax=Tundrisphaera sp. TA3 TaxID=3435775 RepID=UPI003EB85234